MCEFVFQVHLLIITDTWVLVLEQERKRIVVLEEQKKRIQEAMASKPAPSEDNLELKGMKAMGAMEEGDAVLGSGAEANCETESEIKLANFYPFFQIPFMLIVLKLHLNNCYTSKNQQPINIRVPFGTQKILRKENREENDRKNGRKDILEENKN